MAQLLGTTSLPSINRWNQCAWRELHPVGVCGRQHVTARVGAHHAAPQVRKIKRVTDSSGARRALPPPATSSESNPYVSRARNPHRITSLLKTPGGGGYKSAVADTCHRCGPGAPICTNCAPAATGGGDIGFGFNVCFPRPLSSIPTCCTHDTVHFGAQNFST